jgi:hypothetical protein
MHFRVPAILTFREARARKVADEAGPDVYSS